MIVEDLEFLDNVGPVDTVFKREVMPQARSLSQAEVDVASCGRHNLENVRYKSTLTRQRPSQRPDIADPKYCKNAAPRSDRQYCHW